MFKLINILTAHYQPAGNYVPSEIQKDIYFWYHACKIGRFDDVTKMWFLYCLYDRVLRFVWNKIYHISELHIYKRCVYCLHLHSPSPQNYTMLYHRCGLYSNVNDVSNGITQAYIYYSKHRILTQCWLNTGPPSTTLAQH